MRGRPKNSLDSYCRSTVNYRGGLKGRKVKNTYRYFLRHELKRIQKALEDGEVPLISITEKDIFNKYLLKEYCCSIGMIGQRLRKAKTAINRKMEKITINRIIQ